MASGFGLDTDWPVLKGDEELKQSVLKNFAAFQRNTYCLQIIILHKRGRRGGGTDLCLRSFFFCNLSSAFLSILLQQESFYCWEIIIVSNLSSSCSSSLYQIQFKVLKREADQQFMNERRRRALFCPRVKFLEISIWWYAEEKDVKCLAASK